MGCISEFVIPKIKAYWEDIAYTALKYDIASVNVIRQNHQNDVKKCCRELFENWLTTENGVKPKTWSKLLSQLRKVEELTASIEVIEEKLVQ